MVLQIQKEIWLTTGEVAALEGISRQAAHKKAKSKDTDWKVKTDKITSGGGASGKGFLIALSSLSALAQQRWYQNKQLEVINEQEEILEEQFNPDYEDTKLAQIFNLAELKALVGEVKFASMMKDAEESAKPVYEFLALGDCQNKTIRAKQIAKKYSISLNTLYRRINSYEEGGIIGLMRKLPSLGTGTIRRAVPEEVERYIYGEYLQRNKPKTAHVFKRTIKFCEKNGFEVPSRATVYRVIQELNETKPDLVCLARDGEEEYMKRFAEKATRKEPDFVNQVWEGDHHRCDYFINYRGRAVRPWFTLWLDVTSRVVVGWALSIQANGRTIGLALRYGILGKKVSSIDAPSKQLLSTIASLGWDLSELQQLAGEEIPINGLPDSLYIDNGEDYKAKLKKGLKCEDWEYSKEVRSTCDLLDIKARFCTKYSPWAKGHAERWFGTYTDQFSRYMPGYCGKDNKHRPEGLDEQAMAKNNLLLDLEEACYLTEMYILQYHNTVHSSLGMTPLQKYLNTPKVREGIPDERTLDICLMDVEKAKVTASGIQRFGTKGMRRYYKHEELTKYAGRSVVIRFDPNRIGEILCFDPKNGKYICTATNKELLEWNASKDDIQAFQKRRASRKKDVKKMWHNYRDVTLEAVMEERHDGLVMITGQNTETKGMRLITGMEQASKATSNSKKAKPTSARKKTSRFDEFIQKAGNQY